MASPLGDGHSPAAGADIVCLSGSRAARSSPPGAGLPALAVLYRELDPWDGTARRAADADRPRVDARLLWQAAGIASAIGGRDPRSIVRQAQLSCLGVTLDQVLLHDMEDSRPNPALQGRARPCALHEIDAFLSHSWQDPAQRKWEVLQCWRSEFLAAHGREPLVWIDKYCLDQTNVEASLACLPIFLACSRTLLILAGPTYLSRLWCVEEVFISLQTRRAADAMDLRFLCPAAREQLPWFDVAAARCHLQADEKKLLSTIQAACSSFEAFNEHARLTLQRAASARAA